ncbi:U1 small nuclear ribonucleoprotein C [Aristolochia californica]|uniref:U1 small nuclear ribonucleoprotein C n=1 Tax=Aristolochia californica TaxID=171875 RepID=UPI0035DA85D7
MPRYYCDYCDTYLTHDSPSVRKQHNAGYKHKANVRSYYQQFEEQQTQSLIDQKIKEHLGQTAAYQVGATFHQHLASLPPNIRGPRLPVLPIGSQLPMNPQLAPGIRPPIMLRPPMGTPGYGPGPTMPPMVSPPGASPMQANGLTRPPTLNPPGGIATSTSGAPGVFQANPSVTSGGFSAESTVGSSQDSFMYGQTSETNK